jgi:hypothetical protein
VNHLKRILSPLRMKKAVSATPFILLIDSIKSSSSHESKGMTQAGFPPDILFVKALIL